MKAARPRPSPSVEEVPLEVSKETLLRAKFRDDDDDEDIQFADLNPAKTSRDLRQKFLSLQNDEDPVSATCLFLTAAAIAATAATAAATVAAAAIAATGRYLGFGLARDKVVSLSVFLFPSYHHHHEQQQHQQQQQQQHHQQQQQRQQQHQQK
ncbi:hypothetical protein ACSSS7_005477 [Eimeria intestinalis]